MSAQGPEGKIKTWIINYLRGKLPGLYIRTMHQSRYSRKGLADVLLCYNGLFVAIEVKTEIGKTTRLQEIERDEVIKAGGMSIIIYGKDTEMLQKVIDYVT